MEDEYVKDNNTVLKSEVHSIVAELERPDNLMEPQIITTAEVLRDNQTHNVFASKQEQVRVCDGFEDCAIRPLISATNSTNGDSLCMSSASGRL